MIESSKPKKSSRSTAIGLGILAVVLVALCGGVYLVLRPFGLGAPAGPVLTDAYINLEVYVKDQLKAPTTAKFPYSGDTTAVTIKDLGSNVAEVTSYVDAQNSFGAMIRTHYTGTLKWVSGSNWKVTSFKFLDQP